MDLAMHAHMRAFAGTLYALAGAALLWLAVFHATSQHGGQHGAIQVHALASDDVAARRAIDGQWLDARTGATLLVIGFFMQATGIAGTPGLNTLGILMLLGLAIGLFIYAMSKDVLFDSIEPTSSALVLDPQLMTPVTPLEPVELDDVGAVPLRLRS